MNATNSTITSHSWGVDGINPPYDTLADLAAFENPDKAIFFSAGNSGLDGYLSTGSPGTAKNVLTIGAANQLQVENPPDRVRYFVETAFVRAITVWADLAPGLPVI
jgi:hypothetical protein